MSHFILSTQAVVFPIIASFLAVAGATTASAIPLSPASQLVSSFELDVQSVRLVCDRYGRCYQSRRHAKRYYGNGYYPGYYSYGPAVTFGFGSSYGYADHGYGGHGFGGHGFKSHGFGGHGFGGHGFGGHGGGHH